MRYDVAAALNMSHLPEDHPVLNGILDEIPSDDLWGADNEDGQPRGMEVVYKKKNLRRYHLAAVKKFQEKADEVTKAESTFKASSQQKAQDVAIKDASVTIKIESPELLEYMQLLSVTVSGVVAVQKQLTKCQDLEAKLKYKMAQKPSLVEPTKDLTGKLAVVVKFLEDLRNFVAAAQEVGPSSFADKESWEKAQETVESWNNKCLAHENGLKDRIKKLSPLID